MPQPELANEPTGHLDRPSSRELNYLDQIDSETLAIVQQATNEIKSLSKRTGLDTVKIGHNVFTVQQRLKHGQFGKWLKTEFDWSQKTAYRFINVYKCFNCVKLTQIDIALSALYDLAEPAVPASARQEALERGAQGERISVGKARKIVQQHKTPPVTHVTPEVLPPVVSVQMALQPCTTINIQKETSDTSQQNLQISDQNSIKSPSPQNDGDIGLSPNPFPPVEIQSIEIDDSLLKCNSLQEMEVWAPGLQIHFLSRSGDIVSWFQQQTSVLAKRLAS